MVREDLEQDKAQLTIPIVRYKPRHASEQNTAMLTRSSHFPGSLICTLHLLGLAPVLVLVVTCIVLADNWTIRRRPPLGTGPRPGLEFSISRLSRLSTHIPNVRHKVRLLHVRV